MTSLLSFFLGFFFSTIGFFFLFFLKRRGWKAIAEEIIVRAEEEAKVLRNRYESDIDVRYRERLGSIEEKMWKEQQKWAREEQKLIERERHCKNREQALEQEAKRIGKERGVLRQKKSDMEEFASSLTEQEKNLRKKWGELASLSPAQAKEELLFRLRAELSNEMDAWKQNKMRAMEEESERKAKEILLTSMQQLAIPVSIETSVETVALPTEEMKARIIGREGRNIRCFEQIFGVNIVIDDTPCSVMLSGFDPLRRSIAKKAMEKLVSDGRIHPTRIEESYLEAKKSVEEETLYWGEKACGQIGAVNLHPELIKTVGQMRYAYTVGQNLYQHSLEVAALMGAMATKVGLRSLPAMRIGLLHDIGKVISKEPNEGHDEAGYRWVSHFCEQEEVAMAIRLHHAKAPPISLEAGLLPIADAISAARPGARRENLDHFFHRLETLENIAKSFDGVEQAYALQAGQEIVVLTTAETITDEAIPALAKEIRKKIEQELQFPGKIKITVVREIRVTQYAI